MVENADKEVPQSIGLQWRGQMAEEGVGSGAACGGNLLEHIL
jgi:hypothetical protein